VAAATGLGDPGWGPGNADIDGLVGRWIWAGGEDHGLLATFPAGAGLPAGWTAVGQVHAVGQPQHGGEAGPVVTIGGEVLDVGPGWDHFRS
jgi:thiamine-monophosphate kinase